MPYRCLRYLMLALAWVSFCSSASAKLVEGDDVPELEMGKGLNLTDRKSIADYRGEILHVTFFNAAMPGVEGSLNDIIKYYRNYKSKGYNIVFVTVSDFALFADFDKKLSDRVPIIQIKDTDQIGWQVTQVSPPVGFVVNIHGAVIARCAGAPREDVIKSAVEGRHAMRLHEVFTGDAESARESLNKGLWQRADQAAEKIESPESGADDATREQATAIRKKVEANAQYVLDELRSLSVRKEYLLADSWFDTFKKSLKGLSQEKEAETLFKEMKKKDDYSKELKALKSLATLMKTYSDAKPGKARDDATAALKTFAEKNAALRAGEKATEFLKRRASE